MEKIETQLKSTNCDEADCYLQCLLDQIVVQATVLARHILYLLHSLPIKSYLSFKYIKNWCIICIMYTFRLLCPSLCPSSTFIHCFVHNQHKNMQIQNSEIVSKLRLPRSTLCIKIRFICFDWNLVQIKVINVFIKLFRYKRKQKLGER